jgi:alanyl-tRNA synthetase
MAKKKNASLDIEDWIVCVTSWGIPADQVATITKQEIPAKLYYEIADRQEKTIKAVPAVLYSTAHLAETKSLYYANHHQYKFDAKILEIIRNVTQKQAANIVVLDQSSFYPTSGGQEHDIGSMTVNGTTYKVVDVLKVGPCVLHVLDKELPIKTDLKEYIGLKVSGEVDSDRRAQLRNNHTATHIVYASCRKVLGPHVWQHGAKKSTSQAHLDITHFQSLSHADVTAIENEANRIVHRCKAITKGFQKKDEAEKKYGFHLYQGGVVPGNELRVVNIEDTDTEACCGTHADNTAEVGIIKIIKSARISDGIVRLYYVAGEHALSLLNVESDILHNLTSSWSVGQNELIPTAARFFDGYKKLTSQVSKQSSMILDLQMQVFVLDPSAKLAVYTSNEPNATLFISNMPSYAAKLKEQGKGVIFIGDTFVYGLLGNAELYNAKELESVLARIEQEQREHEAKKKQEEDARAAARSDSKSSDATAAPASAPAAKGKLVVKVNDSVSITEKVKGKKVSTKVTGVCQFNAFANVIVDKVVEYFESKGFVAKKD